jgi:hypothetical protein
MIKTERFYTDWYTSIRELKESGYQVINKSKNLLNEKGRIIGYEFKVS